MNSKNNQFQGQRIEFHILQSFPVTCLNRDDVGAPKTAMVGGTTRARVSSQCWKRQVRLSLQDLGVKLAVRTKHVKEVIAASCLELGATQEQADACGEALAGVLSNDTLFFFTAGEAKLFAQMAQEVAFKAGDLKVKEVEKLAKKGLNPTVEGLDIALFGRMVAQATQMNVEAAASFSHAISTHRVSNEVEFFTALDDKQDAPGAAHISLLEYNSATYYRYVCLDLGQLGQLIAPEDLPQAVEAFTKALYLAVPAARQKTQAGYCPWEYAKVYLRKGQPLQASFETAVKAQDGGYLNPSKEALKGFLHRQEKLAGSLFGKRAEFEFGESLDFSIDHLVAGLSSQIKGA